MTNIAPPLEVGTTYFGPGITLAPTGSNSPGRYVANLAALWQPNSFSEGIAYSIHLISSNDYGAKIWPQSPFNANPSKIAWCWRTHCSVNTSGLPMIHGLTVDKTHGKLWQTIHCISQTKWVPLKYTYIARKLRYDKDLRHFTNQTATIIRKYKGQLMIAAPSYCKKCLKKNPVGVPVRNHNLSRKVSPTGTQWKFRSAPP